MNPETKQALKKRIADINAKVDVLQSQLDKSLLAFETLRKERERIQNEIAALKTEKEKIREDIGA